MTTSSTQTNGTPSSIGHIGGDVFITAPLAINYYGKSFVIPSGYVGILISSGEELSVIEFDLGECGIGRVQVYDQTCNVEPVRSNREVMH